MIPAIIIVDLYINNMNHVLEKEDLSDRDLLNRPGPKFIKLFSCSTQLSTKFQLLIKTKIPTNKEVSCFKSLKLYLNVSC